MELKKVLIILFLISALTFFSADAVSIRLDSLMCYETTAETTDDLRIVVWSNDGEMSWGGKGGHDMKDGDSWIINDIIEDPDNQGLEFILYEDDSPYKSQTDYVLDDVIGRFWISPEIGKFTRDLPDGLSSPHTTHYQSSYEVFEVGTNMTQRFFISIQSVKCNDAQESKDEVYITINNENVWEEHDLKSGQTRTLRPQYILVPDHVKMEIWERDISSSDLIGTYEIDITRDLLNVAQSHVFSRDSGIVGDAKYTVSYVISDRR